MLALIGTVKPMALAPSSAGPSVQDAARKAVQQADVVRLSLADQEVLCERTFEPAETNARTQARVRQAAQAVAL